MGKNDHRSISISCEIMDRFRSNFASQYSKFSALSIFSYKLTHQFLEYCKIDFFFSIQIGTCMTIPAGATSLSADFLFELYQLPKIYVMLNNLCTAHNS